MAIILIVDDEFGIADLLVDVLSDEGHKVVTAANGKRGIEVLETERPELIFLDYMMPILDGAGMLQKMSENSGLRTIPVILMSSMDEETVMERCKGYSTFLRKPFRIWQVLALAAEILGNNKPGPTSPSVDNLP
ncbi:response regulator (plasmid) [Lichenicola cladoniae]|uniref:Response regulator n=1 Tax=Lichenicola cladoniae TaxID=1484109 RepID=A0A6M8HYU7_9PROT|nr:response regulator [Lichenicola cladoniae]NPD66634.1 response regulator [Acetobacteraceae bacterium]QKE93744.1 response regulator [Lichenicola cladoniae]